MPKHHRTRHVPFGATNFLSVLEGIEGGFAIFVGIIAGLSFETNNRELLILTAAVSIVVNAINSSTMRYTSEHFIDELDGREKRNQRKAYLWPALIEFVTYLIVSMLAAVPLLLIANETVAIGASIAATVLILFVAGFYRGSLLGRHAIRDGFELASSGFLIVLAGTAAGWLLSLFLVQ